MRLLLKVTLFYLIVALIVMGGGGILTYNIFENTIQRETDFFLVERLEILKERIENGDLPEVLKDNKTLVYETEQVPKENIFENFSFTDTLVTHPFWKRLENYRKISALVSVNDKNYYVEMHDLIIEPDDIYRSVITSQTRLFIILGILLVLSSFLISKWLFKPFENTLERITNFNIKNLQPIRFKNTGIKEFNILNRFINNMTDKISQDYKNLKEFSENASHELQTPIAIAKGKLELLIQSENLSEQQLELINSTIESVNHIGKLNHSLTLLSKIENREFSNLEKINLSELLRNTLNNFREIAQLKGISFSSDLPEEDIWLNNDFSLLKILLNNLMQNAIRHNIEGGSVEISLDDNSFRIRNTGEDPGMSTELLFERFKKSRQSSKNSGLGLAIVKRICEVSNYDVTYHFEDGWHEIFIQFNSSSTFPQT